MPKDIRFRKSHTRPDAPKVHRELPQSFLSALETNRNAGRPHRYTDSDVRAIVSYVSRRPNPNGHTVSFTQEKADEFDRYLEQVRNDRAATLAARLSAPTPSTSAAPRPPLIQRITAAPDHSPIAPKAPLIDFKKKTTADLIGIFTPKIRATLTRLGPIRDLDEFEDIPYDQRRAYQRIVEKLTLLRETLSLRAADVGPAEWKTLDWGLKKIGAVSFTSLRRNLYKVCVELYRVERDAHFVWI